jgi:chromosomal replication initiator protein
MADVPTGLAAGRLAIDTVTKHFGISRGLLLSAVRSPWIAGPRAIAMYLVRRETGWSYPRCARFFHRRDHTTVLAACQRVTARIDQDIGFAAEIAQLQQRVRSVWGGAPATFHQQLEGSRE